MSSEAHYAKHTNDDRSLCRREEGEEEGEKKEKKEMCPCVRDFLDPLPDQSEPLDIAVLVRNQEFVLEQG